jgi:peptidoglycan/LPS O-acetylase OafA/YrhL
VNASMKPRGYFSSLFAKGTRAPADPTSPHFRPDIQGMRAIAVGIVVLDHAHIPGLSGGFIGVDVFFVLSGFLITGLLLGDVAKTGGVRFLNFYARRAARILPAATLVIVATLAASYIVLNVIQARSVAGDGLWSVFFLANYHFAAVGTNYFAAVTATSPLQHFWSLAVEEQFYLVWPFLLGTVAFLTHRRRATTSYHVPRRSLYALLIPITAYSLYLSITQTSANPTAAYFSTFDRTWELGIGALLALTLPHLSRIPGLARAALSWAGLAGVLLAATTFSSHTRIPGYLALVPVLGAAAMVAGGVGRPRYGASSLLAVRPLRFIGDISYSLYLWHWPVLILGAAALGSRDTLSVRVGLIIGSLALSALSYYGYENPARHAKLLLKKTWHAMVLWPAALAAVAITALACAPQVPFVAATQQATSPTSAHVTVYQAVTAAVTSAQSGAAVPHATTPSLLVAASASVNLGNCSAYLRLTSKICNYGAPSGTKTLVVFGSSHSTMWVPALAIIAKKDNWKLIPIVKEACGYDSYEGIGPNAPGSACVQWYAWATKQITKLHPDAIVMGSFTRTYWWYQGESTVISQLRPLTKRFILFSDTPTIPPPPGCLTNKGATQKSCLWTISPKVAKHRVQTSALAAATGVQYLDITDLFCTTGGLCPSIINDIIPYHDGAHLTPQYSRFLAPALAPALNLTGSTTTPLTPSAPTTRTTTTQTT